MTTSRLAPVSSYRRSCYRWAERWSQRYLPGVTHAQQQYGDCLDRLVAPGTDWLDLGCGRKPLRSWLEPLQARLLRRSARLVGCDVELSALAGNRAITLLVVARTPLPFTDASFDLVTANMVVEHLPQPEPFFSEVRRVLRPGGRFIGLTVNRPGYYSRAARLLPESLRRRVAFLLDGRSGQDVFPTYYRANSLPELQRLAAAAHFSRAEIRLIPSTPVTSMIPPLLPLEVAVIKLSLTERFRHWRPNILAVLEA